MTVQNSWLTHIFTLSFDPVDRFWQLKSHFAVVFQAKSNGEVTVHISWHGKIHLHNFCSSGQISMFQESFWGSISNLIKWLGCCTLWLTWKKLGWLIVLWWIHALKDGFLTCEGSFWNTFLKCINFLAEHISLHEQEITVTWDLMDAFLHVSSQLRSAFQVQFNAEVK